LKQNKSDGEWQELTLKWKKWGVNDYMRSYLTAFFPGNEDKFKEIGLIKDDDKDKEVNLLGGVGHCDDQKALLLI